MKTLTLMLALVLAPMLKSAEAVSITAQAQVFFEPTQEDYNLHSREIMLQQDSYKAAVANGDYQQAYDNALFYWTRAWVSFNKAVRLITTKAGWNDTAKLNEALTYMDKAEKDASGAGSSEGNRILALVTKNRKVINDQIAGLAKAEAKANRLP